MAFMVYNKITMDRKTKGLMPYFLVFISAVLSGVIILALKGLYPFGKQTVDYADLSAMLSSFYAHFYDVLHGEKSYFFDWYTALGVNMSFASSGGSIFSVFNLFLFLIPRNKILESFSFYLLMQMGWMSVSMYFYLHRRFRADRLITCMAAVGYGICGFVLMNYTMISWLDYAVYVPLILYYAEEVFKTGRMKGLILWLSLALAGNFYLSAMILLFMFLEAGLYVLLYRPERGVAKLALSVLASGLLSAFATVPQVLQTLSSSRFQNGGTGSPLDTYREILSGGAGGYATRWWVLLGVSLAAAVILKGFCKDLKERSRRLILVAGSLLFVLLSLLFEGIAMLWHMGSYDNYPMRYGFLVYFVFAAALCAYEPEVITAEDQISFRKQKWLPVLGILTVILVAAGRWWYVSHPGLRVSNVLHLTFLTMGGAFLVYLFLAVFKKGRFLKTAVFLWAAEILFYGVLTVGQPNYITGFSEEPEHEGESVRICGQLYDSFDLSAERIDRIKNPDESLNVNYGIYIKQPTLSNLTHLLSPSMQSNARRLGYSIHFTRLLDAGGTVLSDALLNIKHILSRNPQDSDLYRLEKEAEVVTDHLSNETASYGLYACRYTIPFGSVQISDPEAESIRTAPDMVTLCNALYAAALPGGATASQERPFAEFAACDAQTPCDAGTELHLNTEGHRVLYLYAPCTDAEHRNLEILVNGEPVCIPSIRETDNTLYPAHFNNNTICLGAFRDETVDVFLKMDAQIKDYPIRMFTLDLDQLGTLCDLLKDRGAEYDAGSHTLTLTQTAEDAYLLIPVSYDAGWSCTVNGQERKPLNLMDLFMMIPADPGEDRVELTYHPQGFFTGIALSVAGLLLLAVLLFMEKRSLPRLPERFCAWVLLGLWAAAVLVLFAIPVVYALIARFS